jgi:hypothetical protein
LARVSAVEERVVSLLRLLARRIAAATFIANEEQEEEEGGFKQGWQLLGSSRGRQLTWGMRAQAEDTSGATTEDRVDATATRVMFSATYLH